MICVALRVECRLGHSGVRSRDRQLGFVTTVSPNCLVSDSLGVLGGLLSRFFRVDLRMV